MGKFVSSTKYVRLCVKYFVVNSVNVSQTITEVRYVYEVETILAF